MAKGKGTTTTVVSIPEPNIQTIKVKIIGTAPLIFHKWSEKAKKQILEKQLKKAQKGREKRNPKQEYKDSFYYNSSGKIAFPALSIKQALVNAVRNVQDATMTLVRGAVFVMGDPSGLIPVKYKKKEMRSDMVKVGRGTADFRFRGQLTDWSMEFIIRFNADVISAEQVLNLLSIAGFSCGLGEWRPERSGDFGTFEVDHS